PPRLVGEPEPFDPRARMQGVPEAAPERASILEALRRAAEGQSNPDPGTESGLGAKVGGWLRRLFGGASDASQQRQVGGQDQRSRESARWLAARLFVITGWSKVIGRRQAQYIGRMIEMFERGDLQEALRHAIPMGALEGKPKPPALGVPTPRSDLTIVPKKT